MEDFVGTVDVTFVVEEKDGHPLIGQQTIRLLVAAGIDAHAREARLLKSAKSIVAAHHDVEDEYVCITGLSVRDSD
ncbi:hypothetical protein [Caballeronia sp. LZ043]|uniref:hypothetical protein n=1 Tax=Caballeronia sp. LZ043 TaxID=3038569 RepID=UPI002865F591|nr:hypothetical protein [Caballeronia sp. LZ043]MDR5826064.1 hypothetical protein [Caballeronia sp. LZ043]